MEHAEQIALAALVVSLLAFVTVLADIVTALRTRKSEAAGAIYAELHEVHRAFLEHPELRPFFYENRPAVGLDALDRHDPDQKRIHYYTARALAELFFDVFEHIYALQAESNSWLLKAVPYAGGDIAKNWNDYIVDMVRSSEFLAEYLREVEKAIHPVELRQLVMKAVSSRNESALPAPDDPNHLDM